MLPLPAQSFDWNQPAIDFYEQMGAHMLHEWRIMRIDGEALKASPKSPTPDAWRATKQLTHHRSFLTATANKKKQGAFSPLSLMNNLLF